MRSLLFTLLALFATLALALPNGGWPKKPKPVPTKPAPTSTPVPKPVPTPDPFLPPPPVCNKATATCISLVNYCNEWVYHCCPEYDCDDRQRYTKCINQFDFDHCIDGKPAPPLGSLPRA